MAEIGETDFSAFTKSANELIRQLSDLLNSVPEEMTTADREIADAIVRRLLEYYLG